MSRSSSLSGLGRGRARGRRDIAEGEQLAERRPGRFRVEDWEGELAGTQSDAESKWITMEYNAPSPYLGYIVYKIAACHVCPVNNFRAGTIQCLPCSIKSGPLCFLSITFPNGQF